MRTVGWFLLAVLGIAARIAGDRYPDQAMAGLLGVALTCVLVVLFLRLRAHRRMVRWSRRAGWSAIDPKSQAWPWQGLNGDGEVRVKRAWTGELDGFPVTAGDIRWSGAAFAGAVLTARGEGKHTVQLLDLGPDVGGELSVTGLDGGAATSM